MGCCVRLFVRLFDVLNDKEMSVAEIEQKQLKTYDGRRTQQAKRKKTRQHRGRTKEMFLQKRRWRHFRKIDQNLNPSTLLYDKVIGMEGVLASFSGFSAFYGGAVHLRQ
jgi:hypothetical protein